MKNIPDSEIRIAAWLDSPNTPVDAWKTYTYRRIASETELSDATVREKLCQVCFNKKILPEAKTPLDYLEWRRVYAHVSGGRSRRIPQAIWQEIEYARFYKKKTLREIAVEFDISYKTIQKYFKKLKDAGTT